jgi:hypothetical protein
MRRNAAGHHNIFLMNLAFTDTLAVFNWLLLFILEIFLGKYPLQNRRACMASAMVGCVCYMVRTLQL